MNDKISNIKLLWEKYKNSFDESQKKNVESESKSLLDEWKKYNEIIKNNEFRLLHYSDRVSNKELTMPGGYLCNFLETTTKNIFGSSKPGTAVNYEIKCNKDGTSYYIRDPRKENATKEEAEKKFDDMIKPLFFNIVNSTKVDDKIKIIDDSKYAANQSLNKVGVLENPTDFVYIYSEPVINDLYEEFVNENHEGRLEKNHQIKLKITEILNLSEPDIYTLFLVTRFLWDYSQAEAIADKNSPNVILYGAPGTGKTYAVRKSLDFVCKGDRNRYEMIQFHPSFAYEDFIEGIKPKGMSNDGNIKFELVNGVFKKFCIKAKNNPSESFYFVVDEINRANLSSVFGETLSLLEKDYRVKYKDDGKNLIKTQYSTLIEQLIKDNPQVEEYKQLAYNYDATNGEVKFGVPENVFFIGMMNDVDKSIDAFDLALRRRFKWIRKDCDYDVIEEKTKFNDKEDFTNIDNYLRSCKNLNKYISVELGLGKSYEFGHSFFMRMSSIATKREISSQNLEHLFNIHLKPTLKEYLRAVFTEGELDGKLDEALKKFKEALE